MKKFSAAGRWHLIRALSKEGNFRAIVSDAIMADRQFDLLKPCT
jgi:hypothetical protein